MLLSIPPGRRDVGEEDSSDGESVDEDAALEPYPGGGSSSRVDVARSFAAGAADDEEFESSDSDE